MGQLFLVDFQLGVKEEICEVFPGDETSAFGVNQLEEGGNIFDWSTALDSFDQLVDDVLFTCVDFKTESFQLKGKLFRVN